MLRTRQENESLLLKSILNSSPAGVMAFLAMRDDQNQIVDFEYVLMNARAEKITGKTDEQLTGGRLLQHFPNSKRLKLFEKYINVVESGEPFHTVMHYPFENANPWLDIYVEKVYDGFVVTFTDISDLKNVETELKQMNEALERMVVERTRALMQSEENLRISLETAELGTWTFDLQTRAIECSPRCKDIIGLQPSDKAEAEKLAKCIHQEDLIKLQSFIADIRECIHVEDTEVEIRLLRVDNKRLIWAKIKWKTYYDAENCPVKLAGTIMDITQSTEAKEVLKGMLNKKDEFIGIASHELKTPLTSIKGYIQLIKESIKKNDYNKLSLFADKAELNIEKLNGLINDLLDVSKIQAGKLTYNFETFNFDEMLRDSIESVQHITSSHTIVLDKTVDIKYYGDRMRLEQVMNNFLSNAVKYSPSANKVVVSADIIKNYLVVSVKDFGIGIAPENLSKLFDRFYRIDNTSSKFAGLGLGLYISAEILKRHKGTFWIDSELGNGSTFYSLLPLSETVQNETNAI
jgi:two-component system CheB/CheR fusion protein